MAFVGVAAVEDGAFDLDAEEASAVFEGEVVGGHVSPGLGDAEPSSVARIMKRSSAHSPRALGWRMSMPGFFIDCLGNRIGQ